MAIGKLVVSGFTLLEILIVLVIVAVMSTIATLSISAPSYNRFITNVNKIALILDSIASKAIYTDSVIICSVSNNTLSSQNPYPLICMMDHDETLSTLDLFNTSSMVWPDQMQITSIMINGNAFTDNNDKIRFYPNENNTPISIKVSNGKYSSWIDSDPTGNFVVHN